MNNNPINFVDPTGMMLSDIGVYQTSDPAAARRLERNSFINFQMTINTQYAISRGGSVSYSGSQASFLPGNNVWNPGEVAFNGYFDNEGVLTWWYGMRYSLPAADAGTSRDVSEAPGVQPSDQADYTSLTVSKSMGLGSSLGASFTKDRFGRCYFGLQGGWGFGISSLFPAGASFTSGTLYDSTTKQRVTNRRTMQSALKGWSVNAQATTPTTDAIGVSGGADLLVGVVPSGTFAVETGKSTEIGSISGSKQIAFKVPQWLMFPVNGITRCQ